MIQNRVETEISADAEVSVRGVHRLAGAVLVQAIEDFRCGSCRKREEAIRWMEDPSEQQFSFAFCCRMLSRAPEEVRRFLARQEMPDWLLSIRQNGGVSAGPEAMEQESDSPRVDDAGQ